MKPKPFQTFAIEKRLALGLAMQPQPNRRKHERQTPIWYDALIMVTACGIVGGALLVYLKQP
jgi:hypothetical protein